MEKDIASSIRIERTAAAWLARRDAEGWSAHDQTELDRWLVAATAHRVAWLRLQATWRESGRLQALGAGLPVGQVPAPGRWASSPQPGHADAPARPAPAPGVRPDDNAPAGARPPRPIDAAALVFAPRRRDTTTKSKLPGLAAAVAVVAVSLALGWRVHSPTVQPVAYGTAVGALETAALADGSEAILSSDSRIVV
ncbi:MAG: hypothetical protein L0H23_04705, partial [Luteimonas sp.]|nr:hypothetical protein [Luteimonas sp.]